VAVRVNRRVTLAARPVGAPQESDFALDEAPVPEPGPGEVLVRNLYVSVDPYQRGRMSEARSYAKPLEIGDVVTSQAVGEVVESNDPRFSPGDKVVGQLGWQEYAVERGGSLRPVDPAIAPVSAYLHVLGTTGFAAYFGLLDIGRPRPGDTVVGQIAKIAGCRTVGIAGGPEKADDLRSLFGYDAAIDYKNEDVAARLREECPDGVDVYFDNVGGEISAAVNRRLAIGGRIVICGQVSTYNAEGAVEGSFDPRLLIVFRARMEGFLVSDYPHRFPEAAQRLARWLADGKLRYQEDVTEGLENAPRAFIGMLRGENRGKALVKVGGS
jgi:NADPH:quinone reductase